MWDRIRGGRPQVDFNTGGVNSKPAHRTRRKPLLEVLEDRRLLTGTTATLQPIASVTVPSQQGTTIPLLAASGATDAQTYTVTSSNPNVVASIAQGPFWNVGVSYTDPTNAANDFSGTLTYQLFSNLTPNTVSEISNLTNNGYFVNTGKFFNRVNAGFVVQGGSPTPNGSEPNPPVTFGNEDVQELAFTGTDQLAMANSGSAGTDTSQFFTTLAPNNSLLSYGSATANPPSPGFTLFGQLLTGQSVINNMLGIPLQENTLLGEKTEPINPLTISSTTLTSTNPNGTLIIDTTQAVQDMTSTITVTATDTANGSKTSQSFLVTVGAYGGPTDPNINFKPFANSSVAAVTPDTPTTVQLDGASGYPDSNTPSTLTYQLLSQPAHGTVTNFNPSTGSLTYTPDPGFGGLDSLQYQVTATGPVASPATTVSNPGTLTLGVGAVNTGTVTQVGPVLMVNPTPNKNSHVTNKIEVSQIPLATSATGESIVVTINGKVDNTITSTSDINRIVVFGGKRVGNRITINPDVTVPATISSGQGRLNRLVGGGAETREHGWSEGQTTLVGGTGPNQLIGLAGHVHFKPSKSSTLIYAGQPKKRTSDLNATPPGGTVFRYAHGHFTPISITSIKGPDVSRHKLEE
jgi:cyclophilin family peptidyl-prolyl cis-trans isomerase